MRGEKVHSQYHHHHHPRHLVQKKFSAILLLHCSIVALSLKKNLSSLAVMNEKISKRRKNTNHFLNFNFAYCNNLEFKPVLGKTKNNFMNKSAEKLKKALNNLFFKFFHCNFFQCFQMK